MSLRIKQKGKFKKTRKYLTGAQHMPLEQALEQCGSEGVAALSAATPVDSGLTASSWSYVIENTAQTEQSAERHSVYWTNSNKNQDVYIALALRYGHGTRNGGYVPANNFITPALQPVLDKAIDGVWNEVTKK